MRFENFKKSDETIRQRNESNSSTSFESGHNKFSDWSDKEFNGMLGLKKMRRSSFNFAPIKGSTIPESWDWREHKGVTPIKDQMSCGSCWTFTTVAVLEGAHAIETGQLLTFSEKEFVDCVKNVTDYGGTPPYGNPCCMGCSGGDYDASFKWLKEEKKNLILENDMKYMPKDGNCEYDSADHTRITVASYTDVPRNSSIALQEAVAQQPVGLSVDATQFKFYSTGIIDSADCFTETDHGVTAIGYGVRSTDGMKYFIIKNSWGTRWGENGYVRVMNNGLEDRGICGINMFPSYATTITTQ